MRLILYELKVFECYFLLEKLAEQKSEKIHAVSGLLVLKALVIISIPPWDVNDSGLTLLQHPFLSVLTWPLVCFKSSAKYECHST